MKRFLILSTILFGLVSQSFGAAMGTARFPDYSKTASPEFISLQSGNYKWNINSVTITSANANYTIDMSTGGVWHLTLTNNVSITLTNPPAAGVGGGVTLIVTQGGSGSYTVSFVNTISWGDNGAPILNTAVGKTDFIGVCTIDGGATWWGSAGNSGY